MCTLSRGGPGGGERGEGWVDKVGRGLATARGTKHPMLKSDGVEKSGLAKLPALKQTTWRLLVCSTDLCLSASREAS